jgi:hypothetical protein
MRIELIYLVFVEPADILNSLSASMYPSGIEYVKSANRGILVRGTDDGVAELKDMIRMLDVRPKSVRITIDAEFTVTLRGGKPQRYKAATSSLGFSGEKLPLNLAVSAGKSSHVNLALNLVPTVCGDNSTSLNGNGSVRAHLPLELNKNLSVGASILPGEHTVIASGNAQMQTGSVQFVVTASAAVQAAVQKDAQARLALDDEPRDEAVKPPFHQPVTAYKILIGSEDEPYVVNWGKPETSILWGGKDPMRWSSRGSKLVLPVLPGRKYKMTMDVYAPPIALRSGAGVFLGDQKICGITKTGTYKIAGTVPAQKARSITLSVECRNWKPEDVSPAAKWDNRVLGVAVRSVSLEAIPASGQHLSRAAALSPPRRGASTRASARRK